MEKLKEKIGPNAKYIFWGVWGLTILTSVGVWWMATSDLQANAASQKSAIEGAYNQLASIERTAATHPNDSSHVEMEKLVEIAQTDVVGAWKRQWEYQENILVWPESLNKDGTSDFTTAFERFLPIETTTEFPMPEASEVDQTFRKRYMEYIENQLPGLAEVVGAVWTADFKSTIGAVGQSSGAMGMDFSGMMDDGGDDGSDMQMPSVGASSEPDSLVVWSEQSQGRLLEQVFPWRTKEAPSTLDVLYSQEDLWALKGLLSIIASVNKGAKQPFQAHIHEIVDIQLGKAVAARVGQVKSPAAMVLAGGAEMTSSSAMPAELTSGVPGAVTADPADNRYVNNEYKAISAAELRTAMASDSPQNAFLNVAKRLPVALTLKMDQRKLPLLLSECGNAQLMVEVRQVRVNQGASSSTSPMASMGMMSMDMGGSSAARTVSAAGDYPYDLPIEVYGVIYIYNPPALKKLGVEEVTTEVVVEPATPTETDAVPTAAATAPSAAPAPPAAGPAPVAPGAAPPAAPAPGPAPAVPAPPAAGPAPAAPTE